MYLKDPNTKVSYSFRIKPQLLEDLKKYSKVTDRKLPDTLNMILEEYISNFNLNNDYIEGFKGTLINIPFAKYYINIGDEFVHSSGFDTGISNYLDFEEEGLTFEVNKIPNNLDVWDNKQGYISKQFYNEVLHEGVTLLIVPELIITEDLAFWNSEAIINCLKYVYFKVYKNNNITIRSISYKECFKKLKDANNTNLLYKFKSIDNIIYKYSIDFEREYNNSWLGADNENDIHKLNISVFNELSKFANEYNDGTIVNLEDNVKNFDFERVNDNDKSKSELELENIELKDTLEEMQIKQEELEEKLNEILNNK